MEIVAVLLNLLLNLAIAVVFPSLFLTSLSTATASRFWYCSITRKRNPGQDVYLLVNREGSKHAMPILPISF
jgi:hypothetical protein